MTTTTPQPGLSPYMLELVGAYARPPRHVPVAAVFACNLNSYTHAVRRELMRAVKPGSIS